MATNITIVGADFSANPVGFSPPVARGLIGFGLPGVGALTGAAAQVKAAKNLAPGASPSAGSLVGSPTLEALDAIFVGQSKYLDTLLAETKNATLMVVASTAATLSGTDIPALIGNFQTASVSHAFMNITAGAGAPAGVLRMGAALTANGTTSSVNAQRPVPDVTVPRFYAGRVEDGVGITAYDKTGGTNTAVANVNPRPTPSANTIRVGSLFSNSYVGTHKNYFWAAHNVALTDAEIEKTYQWAKGYFSRRGLTI
ncbi:hypothetical protein [Roseomonas chloroacetimidivorans]|uniref:hypothetical protein n=1 Tax=Roseomonas chloroacetimidivorans TaxID=1766656 RepID=UPI003C73E1D5